MSFALEYRKQMLARERERQAEAAERARDPDPFDVRESDAAETPGNRRRVLGALIVAALVLTTFNSNALVFYARGLADGPLGPRLIELSESWHDLMATGRLTRVAESVRAVVADARAVSWQDLSIKLGVTSFAAAPADADKAEGESDPIATGSINSGDPAPPKPRQAGADGSR